MNRIGVVAMSTFALGIVAAVAVLVWPLHANGVTGSALMPKYSHYLAFSSSQPIPDHATNADLRRAGVRVPSDVVWHRRHIAIWILAGAIADGAIGAALALAWQRRNSEPADYGA
jgi:hypothetical protein